MSPPPSQKKWENEGTYIILVNKITYEGKA